MGEPPRSIRNKTDHFGTAVALSFTGTVLAVGAPRTSKTYDKMGFGSSEGKVQVFTLDSDANSWIPLGQGLSGSTAGEFFGIDVALSHSGDVLAVGSANGAWVYHYSSVDGSWNLIDYPTLNGKTSEYRNYVSSVKLSADGRVLATGDHSDPGFVNTFEDGMPLGQKLTGESGEDGSGRGFGLSIALSNDGKSLAVGTQTGGNDKNGIIEVFQYEPSTNEWKKRVTDASSGEAFGYSVASSGDGTITAGGAPWTGRGGNDDYASGQVMSFALTDRK